MHLFFTRFRKQHEQLRAVILRVLRPTDKPAITEGGSESDQQMMDMADANACLLYTSPSPRDRG